MSRKNLLGEVDLEIQSTWKLENFNMVIFVIQFEDDKVIFIEFKTEKSKLNQNQKKIKEIIENKRVGFEEFRI